MEERRGRKPGVRDRSSLCRSVDDHEANEIKEERSEVITLQGWGGEQADVTLPLELCLEWIGGSVEAIIPTRRKWKGERRREEKREK